MEAVSNNDWCMQQQVLAWLGYLLVTPEAPKNGPLPPKAESADKLTVFQTDDKVAKCKKSVFKNKQTIF